MTDIIISKKLFLKYFNIDNETKILKHKRNEEAIQLIKEKKIEFHPIKDDDGKYPIILFMTIENNAIYSRPHIESNSCKFPYVAPDYGFYLSDGEHRVANPEKVLAFIKLMDISNLTNEEFGKNYANSLIDSEKKILTESIKLESVEKVSANPLAAYFRPVGEFVWIKKRCGHWCYYNDSTCRPIPSPTVNGVKCDALLENYCADGASIICSVSKKTVESDQKFYPPEAILERETAFCNLISFVNRTFLENVVLRDEFNSRLSCLPTISRLDDVKNEMIEIRSNYQKACIEQLSLFNVRNNNQEKIFKKQEEKLNEIINESKKENSNKLQKKINALEKSLTDCLNRLEKLEGTKKESSCNEPISYRISSFSVEPFDGKGLFINKRFNIVYDGIKSVVVGIYQDNKVRPLTPIEIEFCHQNQLEIQP